MCWAYLYAETSALCKLLSLTIAYFADDTLTGNWYPPKTVSKLTDRKWFSFSVSHEDNPVWWMFYHAELNSRSVTGFVLQLLVSSVFAWQAAIQSIRADMCERTDALLLAFCTPARMDWHNAMLTVVDLNFETGWSRIWKLGFLLCCTLKDNYERKCFFVFFKWKTNIKKWFYGLFGLCVLNSYVSVSNECILFWLQELLSKTSASL